MQGSGNETLTGEMMMKSYKFATDSETGKIEAASWNDACQKLHDMLPDSAIDNGGHGWIEDEDGERYELGAQ